MYVKVTETNRLFLVKLSEFFFDDLFELLANENVHKYFPKTLNKSESHDFLKSVENKYQEDGFSFWAVIRKEDNVFLGICGILKQLLENKTEYEVGYRILDKYWGNGYGTEAASGCIDYGFKALKLKSIVAFIRDINTQSIRVAEKNEMIFEKNTIFHSLPHRLYRKEFKEIKSE